MENSETMDEDNYPHIREYGSEEHRKQVQAWSILKDQCDNEPGQTIRLDELVGGAVNGLHPHHTKTIARQWENKGLAVVLQNVQNVQNGVHVALTEKGTTVDDPTKIE